MTMKKIIIGLFLISSVFLLACQTPEIAKDSNQHMQDEIKQPANSAEQDELSQDLSDLDELDALLEEDLGLDELDALLE